MTTLVPRRPVPTARAFFRWYTRRRIATGLDGVFVAGLAEARRLADVGPVILAATHVSWWDGLIAILLDETLGTEGRAWMDAANLERFAFFRWCGAFGVDRHSPGGVRAGLHAAANSLTAPGDALWIFVQGRQRPAHLRPLGLERGVEVVARRSGATVVPVALTFGFREAPVPAAVVEFGEGIPAGVFTLAALEDRLAAGLGRGDRFLDGQGGGFLPVVAPAPAGDGPGTRLLAQLARWTT